MIYPIRERITQWFLTQYLKGMVFDIPNLADSPEIRRQVIEEAKSMLTNSAYKYTRDWVLEKTKDEICFKTKNTYDIAFNRGIIKGIQMVEERAKQLASTNATKDQAREAAEKISRNHG